MHRSSINHQKLGFHTFLSWCHDRFLNVCISVIFILFVKCKIWCYMCVSEGFGFSIFIIIFESYLSYALYFLASTNLQSFFKDPFFVCIGLAYNWPSFWLFIMLILFRNLIFHPLSRLICKIHVWCFESVDIVPLTVQFSPD